MTPFFKTSSVALIAAGSTLLLSACGGGAKTPDQLLLGEWDMAAPVVITQQGQTVTMSDGELEFKSDGTTEDEVTMSFGDMSFKIESTGTYSLDGMSLTQTTTNADITVLQGGDVAQQIVGMVRQQLTSQPPQTSTITAIDKDKMVITEPTTGTVMTFNRD